MLSDERYENNVILKTEALQELLTGIKHYPVVDIDLVDSDEVDERTQRQIWTDYTDYTPCLKLTYGDPQTTKGNIIFCSLLKQKLREVNKDINNISAAISRMSKKMQNLRDSHVYLINATVQNTNHLNETLSRVIDQNQYTYSEFLNLLTGLLTGLQDVANALPHTNYDITGFAPYDHVIDKNGEYIQNFYVTNVVIKDTTWKYALLATINEEDESADISVYKPYAREAVQNDISDYLVYDNGWQTASGNETSDYVFKRIQIINNNGAYEIEGTNIANGEMYFFEYYNEMRRILIAPMYNMAYAKYINAGCPSINSQNDNDKTIAQFYNSMVDIISLLDAYETNNGAGSMNDDSDNLVNNKTLNNMVQEIIDYYNVFHSEIDDKIEEIVTNYNNIAIQIDNDKKTLNEKENIKNTYLEWIELVSSGKYILQEKTDSNQPAQDDQTDPNIKDLFLKKVSNSSQAQNRTMYGYKYLKLDHNITWDQNFDNLAVVTDNENFQEQTPLAFHLLSSVNKRDFKNYTPSGTFTITINDKVYTVPIKGFGQSSNQPITIQTNKTFKIQSDEALEIKISNSNQSQELKILNSSSNGKIILDSDEIELNSDKITIDSQIQLNEIEGVPNFYPSTNNTGNLGLENYHWDNGYINNITVNKINPEILTDSNNESIYPQIGDKENYFVSSYIHTSYSQNLLPIDYKLPDNTTEDYLNLLGDTSARWDYGYIDNIISQNVIPSTSGSLSSHSYLGQEESPWDYGYINNLSIGQLNFSHGQGLLVNSTTEAQRKLTIAEGEKEAVYTKITTISRDNLYAHYIFRLSSPKKYLYRIQQGNTITWAINNMNADENTYYTYGNKPYNSSAYENDGIIGFYLLSNKIIDKINKSNVKKVKIKNVSITNNIATITIKYKTTDKTSSALPWYFGGSTTTSWKTIKQTINLEENNGLLFHDSSYVDNMQSLGLPNSSTPEGVPTTNSTVITDIREVQVDPSDEDGDVIDTDDNIAIDNYKPINIYPNCPGAIYLRSNPIIGQTGSEENPTNIYTYYKDVIRTGDGNTTIEKEPIVPLYNEGGGINSEADNIYPLLSRWNNESCSIYQASLEFISDDPQNVHPNRFYDPLENRFTLEGGIVTYGGIAAGKSIKAARVYAAVFNDYAEYRQTIDLSPGHVVVDNDDGSLSCAEARLLPGAQIISDTFGSSMGDTPWCQTPLAVAGRVLVYTYQPRENYHAGMAVCSAPGGTVDIMTRDEIRDYPDCIIGVVSEIPQYEVWGTNQVKVDNRIWIKVK